MGYATKINLLYSYMQSLDNLCVSHPSCAKSTYRIAGIFHGDQFSRISWSSFDRENLISENVNPRILHAYKPCRCCSTSVQSHVVRFRTRRVLSQRLSIMPPVAIRAANTGIQLQDSRAAGAEGGPYKKLSEEKQAAIGKYRICRNISRTGL